MKVDNLKRNILRYESLRIKQSMMAFKLKDRLTEASTRCECLIADKQSASDKIHDLEKKIELSISLGLFDNYDVYFNRYHDEMLRLENIKLEKEEVARLMGVLREELSESTSRIDKYRQKTTDLKTKYERQCFDKNLSDNVVGKTMKARVVSYDG